LILRDAILDFCKKLGIQCWFSAFQNLHIEKSGKIEALYIKGISPNFCKFLDDDRNLDISDPEFFNKLESIIKQ